MPASTLQPMTEVAKPVIDWAAVRAQAGELRRDHHARGAHVEGLGERVDDLARRAAPCYALASVTARSVQEACGFQTRISPLPGTDVSPV